jgi:Cu2+-exporting ATPase
MSDAVQPDGSGAALCRHCDLPVPPGRRTGSDAGGDFCCFGCRIAHELARPAAEGSGPTLGGALLLRLGLGIFLAINIMAFSWVSYAQELFGVESYGPLAGLFAYLLMFLTTAVVVLLGLPLATDAVGNAVARRGRVDSQLLIVVGVSSAYALSVAHALRGSGSLYFDTAAVVLVLVTLGNYLEAQARRRAAASGEALLAPAAQTAWVERDGRPVEIDSDRVEPDDRVRVRPGETVPVDGPIEEGTGLLDESSLTGESRPRAAHHGDWALAGSISLDGLLWVRARRVGAERVVARTRRLLHEARLRQPPIQRLADRVAALFVPGVVALALTLYAWHAWQGNATGGLFVALSVLLISCPCALGLAAPLASWNALRRAAAQGILVDSAVTLERASAIDRLYFDKTGTLTRPRPGLAAVATAEGIDENDALRLAASLESASLHPVARALVAAAHDRGIEPGTPREPRTLPGVGIEGRVAGRRYSLGNERVLESLPSGIGRLQRPETSDGSLAVFLVDDEHVIARFDLTETLRDDARETLEALRAMRIEVSVLTGDRTDPAARLARELQLDVESGLLPADKLERLERARRAGGGRVGMVGDGINDAPVLAAADVGIAIGSAADLAHRAGNVRLVSDRLSRAPLLLAIARHCQRRIRLNLTWAFAYNAVGVPLAAAGLLSPVFSALAMIASSLTIVAVSRGAGRVTTEG